MKDKLTPDDLRRWAGLRASQPGRKRVNPVEDHDEFARAFRDLTPIERRGWLAHCHALYHAITEHERA